MRRSGGIVFCLALAATGCGPGGGRPFDYPPAHQVLDVPADGEIADPHVIRVDGRWILYATNAPDRLLAWSSADLVTWRAEGAVWQPRPDSWQVGGGVWAPHVQPDPAGGWWLYITANTRIGVAWAPGPLGPFADRLDHPLIGDGHVVGDGVFGDVPGDYDERAIDAFMLVDDDGSLVLYFTAYDPVSKIYALAMRDWTTPAGSPPVLVLAPEQDWESVVVEATWVEKHDGRYHLMYSGNFYDTTRYAIGAAVGDSPFGPFVRYPHNPVFESDERRGIWGPGHHCLVDGADDDRLMFYHTKVSTETSSDRRLRYAPVFFDQQGLIRVSRP